MYTVAILDKQGKWTRKEVSEEVYYYIRQLENYITHPKVSKLKEVYKNRFNTNNNAH